MNKIIFIDITVLPLHWALINRDFETTKYLLKNNVNKASQDGLTCLMHAVRAVSCLRNFKFAAKINIQNNF